MKTKSIKAIFLLLGFLLLNLNTASASVGENFNKFVGSEFTNFQGIYIIAGVVVASLVMYIIVNHFNKEDDRSTRPTPHHKRHHHHHHRIVKKTS